MRQLRSDATSRGWYYFSSSLLDLVVKLSNLFARLIGVAFLGELSREPKEGGVENVPSLGTVFRQFSSFDFPAQFAGSCRWLIQFAICFGSGISA